MQMFLVLIIVRSQFILNKYKFTDLSTEVIVHVLYAIIKDIYNDTQKALMQRQSYLKRPWMSYRVEFAIRTLKTISKTCGSVSLVTLLGHSIGHLFL